MRVVSYILLSAISIAGLFDLGYAYLSHMVSKGLEFGVKLGEFAMYPAQLYEIREDDTNTVTIAPGLNETLVVDNGKTIILNSPDDIYALSDEYGVWGTVERESFVGIPVTIVKTHRLPGTDPDTQNLPEPDRDEIPPLHEVTPSPIPPSNFDRIIT